MRSLQHHLQQLLQMVLTCFKVLQQKKHWTYKGKQKGSKTVSWSKLKYLKQTDSSHSSAWQKSFIWENPRTSKIFATFYWKFQVKMACGLNSALLTTFLFEKFQVLFFSLPTSAYQKLTGWFQVSKENRSLVRFNTAKNLNNDIRRQLSLLVFFIIFLFSQLPHFSVWFP